MAKKRKSQPDNSLKNIVIKGLTGSLAGTVLFFAATAVMALICLKKDTAQSNYSYIELAVGAAAGYACGYIAVKPLKKNGLLVGAVSAMPMYFVIAAVSILLSHGGIGVMGWVLAGVMIISSAVGGFTAV